MTDKRGHLILIVMFIFYISCSQQNAVEEHFKSHGMTYPLDATAVSVWSMERVGIGEDELLMPGAQEYIENGIIFIKEYFQQHDVQGVMPGVRAMVLSRPVLFRSETGDVGLMVRVVAYGEDEPDSKLKLQVEILGSDKKIWKVENFAYFSFDYDYRKWDFKGWVYE